MMRTVNESEVINMWDQPDFDKVAQVQIAAFKKIYGVLHNLHNNLLKIDFMADKKELDFKELYVELIKHSKESKEGHTAKAWNLAIEYYKDYTSNNDKLVEEMVGFTKKKNWSNPFSLYGNEEQIRQKIKDGLDTGMFITATRKNTKT